MHDSGPRSLRHLVRRLLTSWSLLGMLLCLLVSMPLIYWGISQFIKRDLNITAKAVARSFRPMILEEKIRDVQFQIYDVLELNGSEFALVRDSKGKVIYAPSGHTHPVEVRHCSDVGGCVDQTLSVSNIMMPIFYDKEKTELFGFLELQLESSIIGWLILLVLSSILLGFMVQLVGFRQGTKKLIDDISETVESWSMHVRDPKNHSFENEKAKYEEFEVLHRSIGSLKSHIKALERDARLGAQNTIVRELSHDLKNPLAEVSKRVEILGIKGRKKKIAETDIEAARKSLQKLGNLIRQLTIYDSTSYDPDSQCDLNEEVQKYLLGNSHYQSPDITIEMQSEDDVPLAKFSSSAFQRLLDNLISNAVDALNGNGKIVLKTAATKYGPSLIIQDNGPGIPEHDRDRIFDFEFTTKHSRGTGLGLAIVKRLCSFFGAHIRLDKIYAKGSAFVIDFMPAGGIS